MYVKLDVYVNVCRYSGEENVFKEAGQSELQMFLLTIERHQLGALTLNSKVWRGAFCQNLRYGILLIPNTVVYILFTRLPYLNSLTFFQNLIITQLSM